MIREGSISWGRNEKAPPGGCTGLMTPGPVIKYNFKLFILKDYNTKKEKHLRKGFPSSVCNTLRMAGMAHNIMAHGTWHTTVPMADYTSQPHTQQPKKVVVENPYILFSFHLHV